MAKLSVSFPVAIGEQIYARAAVDLVKHQYEEIRVGLNWAGLDMRPPGYRPFVVGFSNMLFSDPPYRFDETARDIPYTPFDVLYKQGYQLRMPWFPDLLCDPSASLPEQPYVTLSSKVRFWGRPHLDEIYDRFFGELRRVAEKYRIVLLGEREICRIGEYGCWGPEAIYSMYADIVKELPIDDRTFPTFAGDGMQLARLRRECAFMRHAALNINLGIGGSVALAAAVGKVLALHGCGSFEHINALFKEAQTDRVFITGDQYAYYARLQQL